MSDLVESRVVVAGSIRRKEERRAGTVRIPERRSSPECGGKETSLFRMSG